MTYRTLGSDLYSGTSGVALFLAELFAATNEPWARRTSLGAIQHALSRADSVQPAARLGLFSGWTGIALAAARISVILDDPALRDDARRLLQRTDFEGSGQGDFDLVSGGAGAIAALVILNDMLRDESLLEHAIRLADGLIGTAQRSDRGYSWESPGWTNYHNLTGLSHGVAGVGYSLLELHHATGMPKYRDAAKMAFDYERYWFNPAVENWPDFRKDVSSSYRKNQPHRCLSFWCHGAPGIALSRVRAYEILGDETCKAEADVALRTTRVSLEAGLNTAGANFSLCHGVAGNAESLLYGAEVFKDESGGDVALAVDVAAAGVERYVARGEPWPCGTHVGETPNLMLGLSGIGYFYLRISTPSTPSVLLPRREVWKKTQTSRVTPAS